MKGPSNVSSRASLPASQEQISPIDNLSSAREGAAAPAYAGPAGIPVRAPVGLMAGPSGVRTVTMELDGSLGSPSGPDEALIGVLPPIYPEWLGNRSFNSAHGCRFPYVVGEMARGIASADMVIALSLIHI